MKKKLLLLTLIVLCLGCLFAVGVSATESTTPALDLTYTNLSFSDSVYLKYAVSAENVTEDDVRLLVWTEPQSDYTNTTNATILMPLYLENIEGEDYIIFNYTALAAKQMTDVVYARATVEVNGTTYYSAVRKYSILRYAYTVKNDPASEATLVTMLTDMLNYGASAQKHFNYKANRPANGAWYDIQVVNGTLPDGFTYGLYMDQGEIVLTADPAPEGKTLYWMDGEGRIISEEETLTVTVNGASETYTVAYADGTPTQGEGLEFTLNDDGESYSVTGMGNCTDTEVFIPAEYEGLKVTGIGEKAFSEQTAITKISIPDTVTTISTRAFYGCTGLTELTIPASVTSIGNQIVYKCDNLTTVYYNSGSSFAFLNQTTIKHVVFNGVSVPFEILMNCKNIQSVTIGNNVKSIYSFAFYGCTSLTSITIPDSVTSIGDYTFYDCTSLESITIPDGVTRIGDDTFYACTSLTSISIPDSVTYIGSGAFENCTSLASITIPDSVTGIDYRAFKGCTSLKSVYFTDLAKWCAIRFFDYSANPLSNGADLYINGALATDIAIPDSVTSIGSYTFYGCMSLTSITIPDSVTSIGGGAFSNCTSLTSITIPDSVTSIGASAFKNCTSLTSISIPDNVTSIGGYTFCGCTSLTSISIPDSVTSIGDSAFSNCKMLKRIDYAGTTTGWKAIEKGYSWCSNVTYCIVYCSDGKISL